MWYCFPSAWNGAGVELIVLAEKVALAAATMNMLIRVRCAKVGLGFRIV